MEAVKKGQAHMRHFLRFKKFKDIFLVSFEQRLVLTVVGLFALGFVVAMIGLRFTNERLESIFNEVESRNILAAKQSLEHDLLYWDSSISMIVNSVQISEWYEYKKYGLSREEKRYYLTLKNFFNEASKNNSGLFNITLNSNVCGRQFELVADKNVIRICSNHKIDPISVSADVDFDKLQKNIRNYVPNAAIVIKETEGSLLYKLEKVPGIFLSIKRSNQVSHLMRSLAMVLPITLGILLIGTFLVLFLIWSKLLRAQTNVLNYFTKIVKGSSQNLVEPQGLGFSDLESTMRAVVDKIVSFEQNQRESELVNLSKQIAHDIRSPLTALNLLAGSFSELSEEKRVLARGSINRINDIANSLLERSKRLSEPETLVNNTELVMLSSLVDSIVSEKRIQFREKPYLNIQSRIESSYGIFVRVSTQDVKRVISNLINNSVEAFTSARGTVTISVSSQDGAAIMLIQDDGVGIPKDILSKIGQHGFSHGKSLSNQSGSGLGVYHAKTTIESLGGTFSIDSTLGKGTIVTIKLPKTLTPDWFVEKIYFDTKTAFVSLDDDISIHQIWRGRLQSLSILGDTILEHISFTSAQEFLDWYNSTGRRAIFVVDYELLNQSRTGLDVIEELGIAKRSILVTSRYEEKAVRDRCERLGVKLIPKSMAGFVPIEIERPRKKLDLVFLDDDELVHMTWLMAAKERSQNVLAFKNANDLYERLCDIDFKTPIYVDSNLSDGIKGEDIAKKIFDMGFENVYLATGYDASKFAHLTFLKGIVGKDFPVS